MLPLNEQLTAPKDLPVPAHPDVATWRPITVDDADAIMVTRTAMDRVDHPEWMTSRADVVDELTGSHVEPRVDTLLALDAVGAVLGYGIVLLGQGQETRVQSYLIGGVHPSYRGRGIGRLLLGWQYGRSLQQLASSTKALPGRSMLSVDEINTSAQSLAVRNGMQLARYFTGMERDLAEPIPDIPLPDDVRIVRYSPDLSEATRAARNDSFRDHWGSQPTVAERWESFVFSPEFRADLSFVAVTQDANGDDRVVAFGMTSINEDDWEAAGAKTGYISLIGVVRDWRGKKLAPAVLAAVLRAYRDAGLDKALLDVDSESPTGANTLYERMLFTPVTRELAFTAEY